MTPREEVIMLRQKTSIFDDRERIWDGRLARRISINAIDGVYYVREGLTRYARFPFTRRAAIVEWLARKLGITTSKEVARLRADTFRIAMLYTIADYDIDVIDELNDVEKDTH